MQLVRVLGLPGFWCLLWDWYNTGLDCVLGCLGLWFWVNVDFGVGLGGSGGSGVAFASGFGVYRFGFAGVVRLVRGFVYVGFSGVGGF